MLVYINGVDVSNSVIYKSFKKKEQVNNNANTATFQIAEQTIDDNSLVDIYDEMYLNDVTNIGSNILNVNFEKSFDKIQKVRVGQNIVVGIGFYDKEIEVTDVDYDAGTITLAENLKVELPIKSFVGYRRFSGVADDRSQENFGRSCDTFIDTISVVGLHKLMNREVVIDSYIDKFFREIVGIIIYKFVANDTEQTVFEFDTVFTGTGIANNTNDETVDVIEGGISQKGDTTGGPGTATWSKTLAGSLDLSSFDRIRYRWKIDEGDGALITSFKVRIGTDSGNYYEFDNPRIGDTFQDCRNYEAVKIIDFESETGTVDLTDINYIAYVIEFSADISGNIFFDIMTASTGGFTINNTLSGQKKYGDTRFKGKSPTIAINKLANLVDHFWYIDNDKDLHYYYSEGESLSSFEINDTSQNYDNLRMTVDSKQIVNRQLVEGSDAPAVALYTQLRVADGDQTSFNMDFKPAGERVTPALTLQGLKAFVDTGGGFVEKTVGIEGLADESVVDFVYNFQEKVFRNANIATLDPGDVLKLTYYPYKTLSVRYQDLTAIANMKTVLGGNGIFDGQIIIDKSIESVKEARQRATIEVNNKKNPIISYVFVTDIDGLKTGDIIHIVDTNRSIDGNFQIQKIVTRNKGNNFWVYQVIAKTRLFGYVEFLQLLLRKTSNLQIEQNVNIIIPVNNDETLGITDAVSVLNVSDPYKAGSIDIKRYDFLYNVGSVTDNTGKIDSQRKVLFGGSETGTAEFEKASIYNNDNSLKITSDVGGGGKSIKVKEIYRHDIASSTLYDFIARVKIGTLTNLGGSATVKIVLREYANKTGGSALASHTLFDTTTEQDFLNESVSFTTNGSANYYDIECSVEEAIGVVEFSKFLLEEQTVETTSPVGVADFSLAS